MTQLPEKIGRYTVEQVIGQGAMGVVYRGRDPGIGRAVAIKVIARHLLTNRSFTERFLAEARSAGQLSHPNILTIHDLGEDDGVPFLVMEYLPGRDLRSIMEADEPLSIGKKIDIMVQVARGLHHAHRRSVYHRDIKPGNIRVLGDGQVKIMDFGVAKFLSETPSELTQTGTIVGTGHYMSPEQIQGLAVDQRSDIFSFGVVLYELLSRKKPFDGETFTQVMYKIVNSPPPPFAAELKIPEELVAVVSQSLEKNLRDRFSDFAPIIRRLEGLAEDLSADSEVYLGTEVGRLMAESERLMAEAKYTEAIAALDRARELAPTSREIEHRLEAARRESSIRRGIAAGDELGEAGKLEEALERYRAVLRVDPDSAPVRLAIQRTEKLLDEGLRRKDESERIEKLLKAGRDLLQVKQVKQAADCFDQILTLKPDHQDAIALRAECQAAEGRLEQIAELIDEGRRQMAALNFEAAERALVQVRKIDSSHFEASELLREVERVREARRAFERAEDATHASDWETAVTKLREVMRLEPGFPGAREGLERAEAELATAGRLRAVQRLLRRGKLEEAASELRSVLGDRPEHPAAKALMAQVEAEIEEGKTPISPPPATDATRIMTPPPSDRAVWESPVKGTPTSSQPSHPRSSSVDQEPTMVTEPKAKAKAAEPAPAPAAKPAPKATSAPKPAPAPPPPARPTKPRSRQPLVAAAALLLIGLGGWALVSRLNGRSAEEQPAPAPGQTETAPPAAGGPVANPPPATQDTPAEPAVAEPTPPEPAPAAVPDPEQPKSLAARDAARKAKDEARGKEALRWAPETYRKAELHEEQAADALLSGSFASATSGFESARKEFVAAAEQAVRAKTRDTKDQAAKDQAAKDQAAKEQAAKDRAAKEAAAKETAAKSAPPPPPPATNGAPKVDPAAAEAERLATQAAARGADLNASYPGYAAASEAEARGKQALDAKNYGEAVTQLTSAIQLYEGARTQRSTQEAAVADLLRRYDAAFEAADVNALGAISTLDSTERSRWSQFFKMATDIRADVTPTSTKYDPNGAQVGMQVNLSYLSTDRKRVETSFNKSLYATERDGRWQLVNR